jgi:1-acyl-sn-glycerol-3-phosphate acyltransferase
LAHPLEAVNEEWWKLLHSFRSSLDPGDASRWDPRVIKLLFKSIHPVLLTYFRGFATGMSNIPDGRALYVSVHGGGLMSPDLLLEGAAFYRHTNFTRPIYGLAHRILFYIPEWNKFLMAIGGVEGTRENAIRLLRDDQAVIVYPGGEYEMSRTFRNRNEVRFSGRTGFVKAALEAEAPIVPVGAIGGHGIYVVLTEGKGIAKKLNLKKWFDVSTLPVTISLPWGLSLSWIPCFPLPARLGVSFGKPMFFKPSAGEKNDPHYHAYVRDSVQAAVRTLVQELTEGMGHPGMGLPDSSSMEF